MKAFRFSALALVGAAVSSAALADNTDVYIRNGQIYSMKTVSLSLPVPIRAANSIKASIPSCVHSVTWVITARTSTPHWPISTTVSSAMIKICST